MSGIFSDSLRSDTNEKYLEHTNISVGTSPVEVKVGTTRNPIRQSVFIQNTSNVTIYIGASYVTTSGTNRGYALVPGAGVTFSLGDKAFYAVADSTASLFVMELG